MHHPSSKTSEKVIRMYRAVISLLEKGADINTMKVADITGEAGIGKGTAYEYFKSKEEIIAQAIHYDMEQQFLVLQTYIKEENTLQDKVYAGFRWIDENLCDGRGCNQFFRAKGVSGEITGKLMHKMQAGMCQKESPHELAKVMDNIVQRARSEGKVGEGITPYMAQMIFLSGFIEYFIYRLHAEEMYCPTIEEERSFIYHGMTRRLENAVSTNIQA